MARFQHRRMLNSVWLLGLFLAAQYMLDSSDDLLDLLAAPLFFRHTNHHRINGRKQRDREREFLRHRRAIELHHYAILHVLEAGGANLGSEVKSTSRVFGNGPVQTAPLLDILKWPWIIVQNPKKSWDFNSVIWWPITREFIFPNAFTRS